MNTAIRIERSPSYNMMFTGAKGDFNHVHRKTQRQTLPAKTIYFNSDSLDQQLEDGNNVMESVLR